MISDLWHENSVTTVDRRNNRDHVSIPKDEYMKKLDGVVPPEDVRVDEYFSKRNITMVRVVRKVSTKTIRQMHTLASKKIPSKVSLGMVFNCKPFYVVKPTEREKESCLCKFCLNLRLAFQAYQALLKDQRKVVSSMSKVFSHGVKCELVRKSILASFWDIKVSKEQKITILDTFISQIWANKLDLA